MKLLLFLLFVIAVNLQDAESKRHSFAEIRESMKPVKKVCIQRIGVDTKLIDAANSGNFAEDRKLKCYYKCLMVMTRVMKDDQIVERALLQIVRLSLLEDLIDPVLQAMMTCRPITMEPMEGCEMAYALAKCFYNVNKEFQFYP